MDNSSFDRLRFLSKDLNTLTGEINALLDEGIVKEPLEEKLLTGLRPLMGIVWYLYTCITGWFLFLLALSVWILYRFSLWQNDPHQILSPLYRVLLPALILLIPIIFLVFSLRSLIVLREFNRFLTLFKTERKRRIEKALRSGELDRVKQLLQRDPTIIESINFEENTLVHKAVSTGFVEFLKILLESGFSASMKDRSGSSPLHLAAGKGFLEAASMLISYGAQPNEKDGDGRTPLHLASRNGHKEIVELLLSKKADVNIKDPYGDTPLLFILHNKLDPALAEISLMLIERGADVSVRNVEGQTALHLAADQGFNKTVRMLIARKVELDSVDGSGCTPLHRAVQRGNLPALEALISNGADINARVDMRITSAFGSWTALHFAASRGYYSTVELLLNKGADVNSRTDERSMPSGGYTPLRIALELCGNDQEHQIYHDISRLLKEYGGIE